MALFEVRNLSVSYPRDGGRVPLFSGVSFALEEQTIYDLVGPSGSGKSTLLRACALMLARDRGELLLDGVSSDSMAATLWRRRVCLVPQKPALVAGTVRRNLVLPWTLKVHAGESVPSDDELSDLLSKADLHDVGLARDVSQLSGGQQARVALLRAFATRPPVLLLDEVDAALDAESACAVGRLTKALVGPRMTCMRIRHRAADGFAAGTFELSGGLLAYRKADGATGCSQSQQEGEL
ncbi:ABC transporter ATP-binding protein [Raoultibacter phocaeensis]|uniref:ABC transporter ATP-binding protein n=1 Tax=Raoultibacter phocaeensis TaxID=2479841 RepID=UPI001118FB71|nr:ATP-binding cassette domain-containing protein [Raoultibacter phocaeensis]